MLYQILMAIGEYPSHIDPKPVETEQLSPVEINGRTFHPVRFPSGMKVWGSFKSFEEANAYPITKQKLDLHKLLTTAAQTPEVLLPWEKIIEVYISENSRRMSETARNNNRPPVSGSDIADMLILEEVLPEIGPNWFPSRMGKGVEIQDVERAGLAANRRLLTLGLVGAYSEKGIGIFPISLVTTNPDSYIPFPAPQEFPPDQLDQKPGPKSVWERLVLRTTDRVADPRKTMVKLTGKFDPEYFRTQLWLANGYLAEYGKRMWVSERGLERGPQNPR